MQRKILFLSGIDFKDKSIQVIKQTPVSFSDNGWEVTYIVGRDGSSKGNYYYEDIVEIDNINIKRFYYPFEKKRSSNNKLISLFFSKLSSFIVITYLVYYGFCFLKNNSDCNILYGYELQGIWAARILKIFFRKKKIVSRMQGVFYIKEHFLKKRFFNILFNIDVIMALYFKTDLFIMTNDGTQGDKILYKISKSNAKKSLFLKNGVKSISLGNKEDDKCFLATKYNININKPILLMVSRLVSIKRVDLALKALKIYLEDGAEFNYQIIIIGEGGQKEELETYVIKNNLTSYVKFMGAVNNIEVYKFMNISDFLLSLYESSNIGNPFFESMRCGLPVVAVNNGDTSNFIIENGILINENNIINDLLDFYNKINRGEILKSHFFNAINLYNKNEIWTWDERMKFEIKEVEKLLKAEN